MSEMFKAKEMDSSAVASSDYADFNACPHLCVDVPDGCSTISAKLSDGRRVTFAFVPYRNDGVPACVDVKYHDAPGPRLTQGSGEETCRNHAIGFPMGGGKVVFNTQVDRTPLNFLTLLLDDKHYGEGDQASVAQSG